MDSEAMSRKTPRQTLQKVHGHRHVVHCHDLQNNLQFKFHRHFAANSNIKSQYLEINEYLSVAETKENSTLITEPAKQVLRDCFNHLKNETTHAVWQGFSLSV
jgi:hypothetical protein